MKNCFKTSGFTLIELMVVLIIMAVLSAVILFSVMQYINTGKDSNVSGNLAVLPPAGEVWYNGQGNTYEGFCSSSAVLNSISQMPDNPNSTTGCTGNNTKGVCCSVNVDGDEWAACAQEFSDASDAYCVDSRGVKKEISVEDCSGALTQCP